MGKGNSSHEDFLPYCVEADLRNRECVTVRFLPIFFLLLSGVVLWSVSKKNPLVPPAAPR